MSATFNIIIGHAAAVPMFIVGIRLQLQRRVASNNPPYPLTTPTPLFNLHFDEPPTREAIRLGALDGQIKFMNSFAGA